MAKNLIVILLLLGLAPFTAEACDCTHYAIQALRSVHVILKTIPSIAQNDLCKHYGCYRQGVAFVRSVDDCHTMLHEFVHHYQWLRHGDALDHAENYRREMQAAFVTMQAEVEYGKCN